MLLYPSDVSNWDVLMHKIITPEIGFRFANGCFEVTLTNSVGPLRDLLKRLPSLQSVDPGILPFGGQWVRPLPSKPVIYLRQTENGD